MVVGDTEAVSPAPHDNWDEMTDAALAADLAADAGELLLKVRDEIGFGHPWALGDALAEQITCAEVAALRMRACRLLDDPVMPGPNRHRPIPWPAF